MTQVEPRTHRSRLTAAILAPVMCLMIGGVAIAQTSTSPADPAASTTAPAATPQGGPRKDWGGDGPRGHRGHRHHDGFMGARPDANGNVSRADVVAAQQRALVFFDKVDANHDGVLSRDEREAAHKAMKAERQKERGARGDRPDAPPASDKK